DHSHGSPRPPVTRAPGRAPSGSFGLFSTHWNRADDADQAVSGAGPIASMARLRLGEGRRSSIDAPGPALTGRLGHPFIWKPDAAACNLNWPPQGRRRPRKRVGVVGRMALALNRKVNIGR